ncbi:MAG: MOSC domain-containing protein [Candidatus Eremiobacteraeota bacterium]|nr:MOSC domain-containing protein [Candidatus Eremiobacteraeota bacterium]
MTFKIVGVRTGKPQPGRLSRRGQLVATTFGRTKTTAPVRVLREGLEGDRPSDLSVHAGSDRAVLFYAMSNYEYWSSKLQLPIEKALGRGFGENLTVEGVDERDVCVGDKLQIGDVVLEVNQPRAPCWKIGAFWEVGTLTKDVYRSGRTGWFARVLQEGTLDASQAVELKERPYPALSIQALNDAILEIDLHGGDPGSYAAVCAEAAACEALAPNWRNAFAQAQQRSA